MHQNSGERREMIWWKGSKLSVPKDLSRLLKFQDKINLWNNYYALIKFI